MSGLDDDLEAASLSPGPLMTITKAQYGALLARRTEMTQVPDWVDAPMPGYHWRPDAPDGPHALLAAGDEWGAFICCAPPSPSRRRRTPMYEEERYGPKVRWLRTGARLSGRELCRRVSVSPSYLSDIESGRRLPAPEVSDRIADELGTDRDGLWRLAVLERLSARDLAALTPLAPEVPPRRDGLRVAVEALPREAPSHPGDLVRRADVLALLTLDRLVIGAATRTPEPPDSASDTCTPQERDVQALHDSILPGPHVRGNCRFCDERGVSIERAEPPDSGDGAAADLRGYPVTLYREPEDGSWSVMAPDLPGHVGAAMTIPEALVEAADAMTAWIESAEADGRPVPPPSDPYERPSEVVDEDTVRRAISTFAARLRSGSPAPEGGE